ncbi:putative wsc domain protein [Neofusicoccum parvum UCRNP2]|uniref:Putative wsc domain protein n=1 Tax=Botryosphaeria parva (strain UCR-NP2) TaxID=1287680 RepID=R1GM21_BOTPV|nr:putative wsc domain protein [Neofusicoccum parvum UCRNP2]
MPFSLIQSLVIGLAVLLRVQATWVVQCNGRLYDQRSDPIVQPGRVSHHVHVLCGGNGFNFTMDFNDARNSVCSSCNIKQDMSAYWTPKLYYRNQDGTFQHVPIEGDDGKGNTGGMAIYYLHRPGPDNDKIWPFPPEFRMVAGNPFKRTPGSDFNSKAVSTRCLGRKVEGTDQDLETLGFPDVPCPNGVRLQVTFPGCWNGKDADAPDHVSHVAYPIDGSFDNGRCPSTHPKHIMTLFFEVTYRTDKFANMWWDSKQPFVLATGDPTGYGMHGDFLNGWDPTTLDKAISDCTDGQTDCPDKTFTYWSGPQQQRCKLPLSVNEVVQAPNLPSLPGCNPVSYDMPMAIKNNKNCNNKAVFNPSKDRPLPPINGWEYVGCGNDDPENGRTFPDERWVDNSMTHQKCVDHCNAGGYTYAGLEYRNE